MPLHERVLIERIRAGRDNRSLTVLTGIGDDCAVLRYRTGYDSLVTTDFSLEGIHFRREWHSPESVGHRCLARGLSDIAAMGGEPVAAFLSLAMPPDLPQRWFDEFLRGFDRLAKKFGVTLAGGDTAQSPVGILADIIVVGSVPKGRAVLRSGARPGDLLYVSGELGGSAATLSRMMKSPQRRLNPQRHMRHFFPEPRVGLGRLLRDKRLATAMIDTSDGLSTDLAHICRESGVGAEIDVDAIPQASIGAAAKEKPFRTVELEYALHGGEDYELLFTARPEIRIPKRMAGVRITKIGRITNGRKVCLLDQDGKSDLKPGGWEHFATEKSRRRYES